ncbi:hypothetical protein H9P43_007962 [Blastocladiella emersonii ATCC 22665]|nr:hypothetical protein H9P43_007962 [Blastocladiella emersonii ATCC 22665]
MSHAAPPPPPPPALSHFASAPRVGAARGTRSATVPASTRPESAETMVDIDDLADVLCSPPPMSRLSKPGEAPPQSRPTSPSLFALLPSLPVTPTKQLSAVDSISAKSPFASLAALVVPHRLRLGSLSPAAASAKYSAVDGSPVCDRAPQSPSRRGESRPASPEPGLGVCERRVHPLVAALLIFAVYAALFGLIYVLTPPIDEALRADITLPTSVDALKRLAAATAVLSESHFWPMACFYLTCYTFLQTFSVPGSLMMTVLGGALFLLPVALALVSTCTALGASISYTLSLVCGGPLVDRYLRARVDRWRAQLASQHDQLFNYIVFLRVAPVVPNWFINLASPHLGITLRTFFLGTLVGVLPPSFVYARLGSSIQALTSDDFSVWNPLNLAAMATFCALTLLPIAVKRYQRRRERVAAEAVAQDAEAQPLLLDEGGDDRSRVASYDSLEETVTVTTAAAGAVPVARLPVHQHHLSSTRAAAAAEVASSAPAALASPWRMG